MRRDDTTALARLNSKVPKPGAADDLESFICSCSLANHSLQLSLSESPRRNNQIQFLAADFLLSKSKMSPSSTPTVVILVPGAWHAPDHYSRLLGGLQHHGLETLSQRNSSCDATNPHETSTAADASAIRQLISSQSDKGYDVVIAMHSYGGCPGAAAAHGLSKTERQAAGQQGGVIGLIFICAFVAEEGDSLISKLPGGVRVEWMILHVSSLFRLSRSTMTDESAVA